MAANAYIVLGTLNEQPDRLSDATDLIFVRTATNGWVQVADYFTITDTATGTVLGYFLGSVAPVSGTDSYNLLFGGTATFDSALETATAGASNGALEDINSAVTYDKDQTSVEEMRVIVGQLQSASNAFGVDFREATVSISFPAV